MLSETAQRETRVLREMLVGFGGKMIKEFRAFPPFPANDPIVIETWSIGDGDAVIPLMLSVRQNSGKWTAFGLCAGHDETNCVALVEMYLSSRAREMDEAKK